MHGHPRTKSRARRRTSTAAEALWCKRLPRRQRRRRREGRGLERALASTRHGQSLRRRDVLWHSSGLGERTQATYVGNVRQTIRSRPTHRTTYLQTCANTSDQQYALTVTELHE